MKYDLTIGNNHGVTEKVLFDLAAKTLTTNNFFYNSKFRRMVEPSTKGIGAFSFNKRGGAG